MTINSVLNAGLTGMHTSQREMAKAAEQIAGSALPAEPQRQGDMMPTSDARNRNENPGARSGDLVEPLIELRRQEHIFTASAKIVAIADETLGSLIDVTS